MCLGNEPNTLYPFGEPNAAARSVMSAIFDGPIDMAGYQYQPVILTQLPSLENGDAQIEKDKVEPGDQVVDANGDLILLKAGDKIRPAGCRADDCLITYDGVSSLEMDKMTVTFRMRSDVTWSDGTPMTSDDAIYAFQIASASPEIPSTYLLDRTETYESTGTNTVQWWGKPGFIDPSYVVNFWQPAPKHKWSEFTSSDLPHIDLASRTPLGWGPYKIEEWLPADHITLVKNPYYYRAAEGLPKFDTLTFRFIADPDAAISELTAGRCDLLDPTIRLDSHVALLQEMQRSKQAQASIATGLTIEWFGLGIVPASYDNGYDTLLEKDREDIFSDPRTRRAIAMCMDRQKIADTVLFGFTKVPASFVPFNHPLHNDAVAAYSYDVNAAIALLEQAGWRDHDGNLSTPRRAVSVKNVGGGTPLLLDYYTTTATQRRQVTEILSDSLMQCGIGLNVHYLSQNELYEPGPEGPLFGRHFDAAEYAMGVQGVEPPCLWFTSAEIPNAKDSWIGTNISGYSNAGFDAACKQARLSLPDDATRANFYSQAQTIFADELPSIPLYFRLKVSAARPDLCNFELDSSAEPLWNIESFDVDEACKK